MDELEFVGPGYYSVLVDKGITIKPTKLVLYILNVVESTHSDIRYSFITALGPDLPASGKVAIKNVWSASIAPLDRVRQIYAQTIRKSGIYRFAEVDMENDLEAIALVSKRLRRGHKARMSSPTNGRQFRKAMAPNGMFVKVEKNNIGLIPEWETTRGPTNNGGIDSDTGVV